MNKGLLRPGVNLAAISPWLANPMAAGTHSPAVLNVRPQGSDTTGSGTPGALEAAARSRVLSRPHLLRFASDRRRPWAGTGPPLAQPGAAPVEVAPP